MPLNITIQLFILNFFVQQAEGPVILYRKEEDKNWCLMQCQDIFETVRVTLVFLQQFENISRLEFIARSHEINVEYKNVLGSIEKSIVAIEKKVYENFPLYVEQE